MDRDDHDQEEQEEEQRVTAESYGALDTSHVTDDCWMIKIPPKLSQLFEQCPEGTELGELVFTKGGTAPNGQKVHPSLAVHVSEHVVEQVEQRKKKKPPPAAAAAAAAAAKPAGSFTSTTPLHYSLEAMTKKIPVMHPFVRHPQTGRCQLLGTVRRTANLQVKQDASYRALLKHRLVASNVRSNRFVKPIDAAESIIAKRQQSSSSSAVAGGSSNKRGFGNAVYEFGKRKLEAANQSMGLDIMAQQQSSQSLLQKKKKARQFADSMPLRSVLFELFEIQRYWTVKDLKAAAAAGGYAIDRKREQELREILKKEIGEYHRAGDHKFQWELRREFRQQQQQQQAATATAKEDAV